MKQNFLKLFPVTKPVIGMVHLDYLTGPMFHGLSRVINRAIADISALQRGGVNGILIENWKENSLGAIVSSQTEMRMLEVVMRLKSVIKVPFGINVLNNDYQVAFKIAKIVGANFVQLDVFTDEVVSDFKYNILAQKYPFEIKITPAQVWNFAKSIKAADIPLIVFVQPKHYQLLRKSKDLASSVRQAIVGGADGIIITKATGIAPSQNRVKQAIIASGNIPVGIGSGLNAKNITKLLAAADFAIIGSAFKYKGDIDNPVSLKRVAGIIKKVMKFRFSPL
jgi:uncharacterized protein